MTAVPVQPPPAAAAGPAPDLPGRRPGEYPAELAEAPQGPADLPGAVLGHAQVDVGEDEVLPEAAAADDDLAVGVDDVAVAVADPVVPGDARVLAEVDVVAAHEVDAV